MILSELVGLKVIHKKFGHGVVTDISVNISGITVLFENGDKRKFVFPDAFRNGILSAESGVVPGLTDAGTDMCLKDRIMYGDKRILDDMKSGKYRIDHDFGEAAAFIPPLSVIEGYVPNEVFWDLAVKFEYRLGKVMSRMNKDLPIAEILRDDYMNIYLSGEPSTGKNRLIEVLASVFGFPLYITNMSFNSEEDQLTGMTKVYNGCLGFYETPFLKAFKRGGIILLDEITSANPGVLVALNDMLISPFLLMENNVTPVYRNPLCIVFASSNPVMSRGICSPLNEATERRFNVVKILTSSKEMLIKILSVNYPEDCVTWAVDAYEKCRRFLLSEGADEVYRSFQIDSVRAVLNDLEEGRSSDACLDNYWAKASIRDPELGERMRLLCRSMPAFEYRRSHSA